MFEIIVEKEGLEFLGWREVPVVPEVLGHKALGMYAAYRAGICRRNLNDVAKGLSILTDDFTWHVVCLNRAMTTPMWFLCSSRTIVYKGMFLVGQLRTFFHDLQDADYESAIAIVHSRFSTNTNPSWETCTSEPLYGTQR